MQSICFKLFDAHSVFFPNDKAIYGGAEVRGVTIAKELAKKGIKTTVIISQYQHPVSTCIDNVNVESHFYYAKQNNFLKKVQLTLTYFWRFKQKISKDDFYKWQPYIKANAEFYAAFEITESTQTLVDFCKTFQKKFLLFVASDGEVSFENEKAQVMNVKKELAKYISAASHAVFVQNAYQLQKLNSYFNIKGIQLNNPLPLEIEKCKVTYDKRKYITWVGKSSLAKQPLAFVHLAVSLPQYSFFMVMNKNEKELHQQVIKQLPANVTFEESLPFSQINNVLNNSLLFVNTSLYEGFPNTFLQAGFFSVPIVSLHVNPDNFLDISQGGMYCSGNMSELKANVVNLLEDSNLHQQFSNNVRNYVLTNHNVKSVVEKIIHNLN